MTFREELWGPWIEHDGKGCPDEVIGRVTHCVGTDSELVWLFRECDRNYAGWYWSKYRKPLRDGGVMDKIIRYRIRKPRGLTILEDLLENLPAPTSPKVDA